MRLGENNTANPIRLNYLPLVSREWRNGVQLYLLLLPFFHSLLTKGRIIRTKHLLLAAGLVVQQPETLQSSFSQWEFPNIGDPNIVP